MGIRIRLREAWSRLTLASKLTVSYLAPILVIAVTAGIVAGIALTTQLQRAGRQSAARAAEALGVSVARVAERYHENTLGMEAESAASVIEQFSGNPEAVEQEARAYVAARGVSGASQLYLVRTDGSIAYHPYAGALEQRSEFLRMLSSLTPDEPTIFRYDNPLRPEAQDVFHAYAAPVAGTGLLVVAAGRDSRVLGSLPQGAIREAIGFPSPDLAAVVLDREGNLLAQTSGWPDYSEGAREIITSQSGGVAQVHRVVGRELRYLAWQSLDVLGARVGVVYDADYLERLFGQFIVLFGVALFLAAFMTIVLSRITSVFVTRPVRRATARLVGVTGAEREAPEGDELANLVRELLRSSVKLRYERLHREQAEEELEITATVYRNIGEGILVMGPDTKIARANPAFTRISGYTIADVRDQSPAILIDPAKREEVFRDIAERLAKFGEWQGEVTARRKNGESVPILLSVRTVFGPDDESHGYIAVVRDISDIKSTQDRLQHLANHDPLTDLPNRTFLSESLDRVLETRRRRGGAAAALFIDVDHFKDVNDSHGHPAGDELLQIIASRLRATFRAGDIISRFGGDEFVVVLTEVEDTSSIDEVVRRMLNHIREPARVEGITVRPSATAGIALFPESGGTAEDLLKNADAAMYEAKRIGRGSYRFHDPGLNEAVRVRLEIQDRVRRGLQTDEFILFWQPVFSVADNRMVGAEALIRWRRDGELLSPGEFMPQIEGSQIMLELGAWVLQDTVETLSVNEDVLPSSFRVAVNVSAIELIQRNFVDSIVQMLAAHNVAPSRLGIEVTEGAVVRDVPAAQRVIRELQGNGVRVYLDDFGVGYSSLQYLREFGVDAVKLDKSFLTDVPDSIPACSLVRGFVDLAHGLGLRTTIEGVERPQQEQYLRAVGCDTMQGYHPGRPVPAEELIRRIGPRQAI
jgi:diguanylate cyclase (GGDEF)-like protein/PAS domain S-box-containing protein